MGKVEAIDLDADQNAEVTYKVYKMTILFMSVIQQIFWLQVKGIKSRKYTSIH